MFSHALNVIAQHIERKEKSNNFFCRSLNKNSGDKQVKIFSFSYDPLCKERQ
jgi:hypothetical protein